MKQENHFVPRLPEAARKKLKTGGAHAAKNGYRRSAEKRTTRQQTKEFSQ